MAKSIATEPNRSAFLRAFLQDQPKADLQAANVAWTGAGNQGEISPALFYSVKRRIWSKRKGGGRAAIAAAAPSRSEFIRAILTANPRTPFSDVQRAYPEAGHPGALNVGLYYNGKSAIKKQGHRPAAAAAAAIDDRSAQCLSMEGILDQLIQRAVALNYGRLADDLRNARRRAAVALVRS